MEKRYGFRPGGYVLQPAATRERTVYAPNGEKRTERVKETTAAISAYSGAGRYGFKFQGTPA